jgi:hypothetical protein
MPQGRLAPNRSAANRHRTPTFFEKPPSTHAPTASYNEILVALPSVDVPLFSVPPGCDRDGDNRGGLYVQLTAPPTVIRELVAEQLHFLPAAPTPEDYTSFTHRKTASVRVLIDR